ncbi:hypothetical protein B0H11DRAFT_1850197 [Mycena galericulata]|nr:hypothetical protein B0H11DRAFT_1850197 [Mycena galericulata]
MDWFGPPSSVKLRSIDDASSSGKSQTSGTNWIPFPTSNFTTRGPEVSYFRRDSGSGSQTSAFNTSPVARINQDHTHPLEPSLPASGTADHSTTTRRCSTSGHHLVQGRAVNLSPFHPSDTIHQYLINTMPDADVVIAHDEIWISVLDPHDQSFPVASELLNRILGTYEPVLLRGAAILQRKSPKLDLESHSQHLGRTVSRED